MVFLTHVLGYAKRLPRKYLRSGFMDSLRITVKGGAGGMGLPRYGGIGGRGGHVYVAAERGVTLQNVMTKNKDKKLVAGNGGNSASCGIIGEPGSDLTIKVPPGIQVYTADGALLGDLDKHNTKLKVAEGGLGGCPETGFSGQKGENRCIVLDLKLIADVGLVGFPNAGKSTLLRAVSHAKPKVAAYPFTTIKPHLGIMKYPDLRTISVADLPGLIEGAHANIGLGHKFLKHVDRTKLLVYLVDVQGFQLSQMHVHRSCIETVLLLNKEVELYKPDLLDMPSMLIVNKMDTADASNILRDIAPALKNLQSIANDYPEDIRPEKFLRFEEIITTSLIMKNRNETAKVKDTIRSVLDKHYTKTVQDGEFTEEKLIQRIKREIRQEAPTLV